MKIAVITGASSGMGREFVRQTGHFYRDLDEIWVIARRKERLERLRKESSVPLRIFDGDLLKKQVYKQYHSELKEWQPEVRMLVNAAGFGRSGKFGSSIWRQPRRSARRTVLQYMPPQKRMS